MDLEIFTFLFSENEEQRNTATSVILEAMRQPDFLNFLIQSLASIIEKSSITENINLIQAICIVLHKQVNNKKKDMSFFKEDQIDFAYKALFEILFNIPFTIRRYIIEVLGSFFTFHKYIDYSTIILQCLNIIEQNEYIGDTTTALNLINLWIGQQNKTIGEEKENRELCIQKAYPIISLLVKQSLEYFDSLPPEFLNQIQINQISDGNDGNEFKNLKEKFDLLELFCNFLEQSSLFVDESISMSAFITLGDFKDIINSFAIVLHLNIHGSSSMTDAKISIIELFRKINFCFKPFNVSKKLVPFYISFSDEMGVIVISSILDCTQICQDYRLLCTLLQTIMIYLRAGLFYDIILVDDFITQILMPASFLSGEDLQIFSEIPAQYIGFCLLLDDKDANYTDTLRQCIANIIEVLPKEFVQYLFTFLDLPSSSAIEAEAKVFLKKVVYLYFNKKNILESQAEQVILEFKENGMQMEDYYFASLLSLLSTMDPDDNWFNYKVENEEETNNTNLKDSIEIAIFSLLNSNSVVIQIAAVDLLYNLIDEDFITMVRKDTDSMFNSLIPLGDIVESILNLAATIQHPKVGGLLEKLVLSFPDIFLDSSMQIIDNFFHLWCSCQFDDDADNSSAILVFISRIIMEMPQNCETLYKLSVEMVPEVLEALQNDAPNYNGFKQLIDILGCLSDKIDEPPDEFFMMILSMVLEVGFDVSNSKAIAKEEEEEDEEEDVVSKSEVSIYNGVTLYIRYFSVVICSLICRKNFFTVPDAVDYVIKIIENLFVYDEEISLFASGLIITTCLIQSAAVTASALEESKMPSFDPSQFITLASKAAEFVHYFNINNYILDENEEAEEESYATKMYDDEIIYDRTKNKELFVLAVITLSSALITNEEVAMEMLNEKIVYNWIQYHKLCYDVDEKLQFIHWSTIALLILSKYGYNECGGLLFKIAVEQFIKIKAIEEADDYDFDDSDKIDENDPLIKFNISEFPFNDLLCDKEFSQIDPDDQRFQFLTQQLLDEFLKYIQ